jgi:hypothetical protein
MYTGGKPRGDPPDGWTVISMANIFKVIGFDLDRIFCQLGDSYCARKTLSYFLWCVTNNASAELFPLVCDWYEHHNLAKLSPTDTRNV